MAESRFDKLVKCIGFQRSALSVDQEVKINTFIDAHPENALLELRLFPNLDTTSDENIPTGMQAIYSPAAEVDPTVIGDNLFQMVAVSSIVPGKGQTLSDEFFASKQEMIKSAVDQVPEQRVSDEIRNKKNNKEINVWAPELGGPNSFVGVYSQIQDGDHRQKDYFIVGRGTVPLLVQNLKESIAREKPTYRQLLYDDKWVRQMNYVENTAKRNLCRGMNNVSEACGVLIERTDDISSKLMSENDAHPEMAVPEWKQKTHSIQPTVFKGQPAVVISHGVVPVEDCFKLKDQQLFVVGNPYDGIAVFPLSNITSAVPADTGRKVAPSSLVGKEIPAERLKVMTWDAPGTTNVNLHPNAFNPIGADFKNAMKDLGWNAAQHEMKRMIPICGKIWNPAL